MEPLTTDQIIFVRQQVARWLSIKFEHERTNLQAGEKKWPRSPVSYVHQLIPDADHSALLWRLLEGKEPLPEPPPLENAYPVYPD